MGHTDPKIIVNQVLPGVQPTQNVELMHTCKSCTLKDQLADMLQHGKVQDTEQRSPDLNIKFIRSDKANKLNGREGPLHLEKGGPRRLAGGKGIDSQQPLPAHNETFS